MSKFNEAILSSAWAVDEQDWGRAIDELMYVAGQDHEHSEQKLIERLSKAAGKKDASRYFLLLLRHTPHIHTLYALTDAPLTSIAIRQTGLLLLTSLASFFLLFRLVGAVPLMLITGTVSIGLLFLIFKKRQGPKQSPEQHSPRQRSSANLVRFASLVLILTFGAMLLAAFLIGSDQDVWVEVIFMALGWISNGILWLIHIMRQ